MTDLDRLPVDDLHQNLLWLTWNTLSAHNQNWNFGKRKLESHVFVEQFDVTLSQKASFIKQKTTGKQTRENKFKWKDKKMFS